MHTQQWMNFINNCILLCTYAMHVAKDLRTERCHFMHNDVMRTIIHSGHKNHDLH